MRVFEVVLRVVLGAAVLLAGGVWISHLLGFDALSKDLTVSIFQYSLIAIVISVALRVVVRNFAERKTAKDERDAQHPKNDAMFGATMVALSVLTLLAGAYFTSLPSLLDEAIDWVWPFLLLLGFLYLIRAAQLVMTDHHKRSPKG